MNYSVLMSVYHKEKADNLRISMKSIWEQTVPPDEFVLVCDGPLTPELDIVIEDMLRQYPSRLKVLRLKENVGLGKALNEGLKLCRCEIIARMDSDDISRPDRCERQLKMFAQRPELDIISGVVEEFAETPAETAGFRAVPEYHSEIIKFAKSRNPFNHPCIMYRKSVVEAAGGYKGIYLLEDYYLWVRILMNGGIGYNLQSPLLWMRAGNDMYRRRSGWKYVKAQVRLFNYMKKNGFISTPEWMVSICGRCILGLVPNWIRAFLYKSLLRKKNESFVD